MPKITFGKVLNVLIIGVVLLIIGRYFYMKPRFINGERVPAIEAELKNGATFNLSDLRGQYVLLDFWGSWCGPCRAENPELVKLNASFAQAAFESAEGFAIVSIGVEENRDRWERAIAQDGLNWPYHIMDKATSLRFFDGKIANDFGIKQVPTKYLLNPEGQIIAVDPTVEQVRDRLEAQLAD
ncbi:MAG: TlpA disulfide reductase family protein [Phaeodactylibacter sp.]|uniref:TlpA family protein disulfide reductase n=1 Tax=Phaeodactylibacter sp. TaxID=1940289 RepID=UPI0032EFD4F5